MKKKLAIIGCGGFGREVLEVCIESNIYKKEDIFFFEKDELFNKDYINNVKVLPQSSFDANVYKAVISIANPEVRSKIVKDLPQDTEYANIISNKSSISKNTTIGNGVIIMDYCYITDNSIIGNHSHINNNSSIGHDTVVGDFFTTAAGVRISGLCNIGNIVYFGNNSSVRQGINICDNVTIGMNSSVIKNISKSGTYFGLPCTKLM